MLFTCFNKNLAAAVRASLSDQPGVEVVHFHELCDRLGREAGVDLPDQHVPNMPTSFFSERLPNALAEAVSILGTRYDAIVVDEGQDFEDVWWVPLVDLLHDAASGVLYIFFDERQDLYHRARSWPIDDLPFELTENCRSTRSIHRLLRATFPGALDQVTCQGPEGRSRELIVVGEGSNGDRDALRRVLHRLRHEENVDLSDIVVLTPRNQQRSQLGEGLTLGNVRLSWATTPEVGAVQVSTIHSFKGLERPVVVLTELGDLRQDIRRELLYVARSRASNHLVEIWPQGGAPEE